MTVDVERLAPALDCARVVELLSSHIDAELSPPLAEAVRAHLASCDECTEQLALLQAVIELLHALPPQPPPGQTRARLLALFRAWATSRS